MNSKKYHKSAINEIQPPADSGSGIGLDTITWTAIIGSVLVAIAAKLKIPFLAYMGGKRISKLISKWTLKSKKGHIRAIKELLDNPSKLKQAGLTDDEIAKYEAMLVRNPGVKELMTAELIKSTFEQLRSGKLTLDDAYDILKKYDKDSDLWNDLKAAYPNAKRRTKTSTGVKITQQRINYNALPSITLRNSILSDRDFITLATKKLISPRWSSSYGLSRDWTRQFSLLVKKIDNLTKKDKDKGFDYLYKLRSGKKWGGRSIGFISPEVRNAIDDFYALRNLGNIEFRNTTKLYNRKDQPLSLKYWRDDLYAQLKEAGRSSWWLNKSEPQRQRLSKLIFSMLEK
jgi:hypothetical protein